MRQLTWCILFRTVACSSILNPVGQERVIGAIAGFNQNDPRIEVPGTVARGQQFQVEVTTYGSGCTSKGETEVRIQGLSAVITPYAFEKSGGRKVVCPDILNAFRHVATVRFEQPGTARVVVQGRQQPSGEVIAAERTVVVQ